jgi:thiamine-phosphate diphosphorylase
MRPLPRTFAVTDRAICERDDFPVRAAAIASGGPAVALLIRAPDASTARQLEWLDRARALVRPPEAALFAHGDPALARAAEADGVQLRLGDLSPQDARPVLGSGWIGVSVHSLEDALEAFARGADYVVAGNVFETTTHPGRPARGLQWLGALAALPRPVIAIGGVTAGRAALARQAGAWGVAAIAALWHADDPAAAVADFLEAMHP